LEWRTEPWLRLTPVDGDLEGRARGFDVRSRCWRRSSSSQASSNPRRVPPTPIAIHRKFRAVDVLFEADRNLYRLAERNATGLAENLRITAAEHDERYGVEAAETVADVIEDVLVGNRDAAEPIRLEEEAAEAVFYSLNMTGTLYDAHDGSIGALYYAVRAIHRRRLGQQTEH
jgi:hypothetical protein